MPRTANEDRAEKAYRAILNYESDSSTEECMSDLLGDLRHLCEQSGYDFAERDDVGRRNFEAEIREDEGVRPDGPETDRGGLIGQGGY